MNLKILSVKQLLSETKNLAIEERRLTLLLIEHLREIERRLLFLEMGYASLFEFCVKELALSEGSTHRRLQAMRLIRDLPETKESLENGSLSLSNAAKLQSFFRDEKKNGRDKTPAEKQEIAKKAENHSQKECEQMLFEVSPKSIPDEKDRVVSPTMRELKFVVSEELFEKIGRLKGLLAHSHPGAGYAELMEYLVSGELRIPLST